MSHRKTTGKIVFLDFIFNELQRMSRGGSYNGDCQEFFKESKLYISKQSQLIHELESKLEELSEQR